MKRVQRGLALSLTALGLIWGLGAVSPLLAAGDAWPTKPVTIVVGFTPGGMADVSTRIVADKLQAVLGQPVVIQNKGGAGGMLGIQAVAAAKPDGYTAYGGSVSQPLAISPFSKKKDVTLDEFEVVGGFLPHERALFIQSDAPYKTWEEFVDYVKKNPDTVSIGFGAACGRWKCSSTWPTKRG